MSEKLSYSESDSEKKPEEKISRRNFLARAGKLGLGMLGASFLLSQNSRKENKPSLESIGATKSAEDIVREHEEERLAQFEKVKTDEEKEKILQNNNPDDIAKICERVASYQSEAKKYAEIYHLDPKLLLGLIFIESKGESDAKNISTGAMGLCQFTRDAAKQFGLIIEEYGQRQDYRTDSAKSIEAAAKYIAYYKKYLGSEDLAIESFHMGYGTIFDLIQTHVAPKTIKKYPSEITIPQKISYSKIYFDATRKPNSAINNFLFHQLSDDSANYYFKILAAAKILSEKN